MPTHQTRETACDYSSAARRATLDDTEVKYRTGVHIRSGAIKREKKPHAGSFKFRS